MSSKKTYYEILGVPRTATTEQIKRQYRQLVRRYHPDVAEDKAAAQRIFLEINEAYETLVNPDKRVIYDASLDSEMFRTAPTYHSMGNSAVFEEIHLRSSQRGSTTSRVREAERLVQGAQLAFLRGQFQSAISACNEARRIDPTNVLAHTILGDILKIQNRIDDAIAMYTIAAQLEPSNREIRTKLERLLRTRRPGVPVSAERQAALKMGLNLMGGSTAVFLLALLAISPGQPITWIQQHLPFLGQWTTMLLAVLALLGGLTGFLLSVNETVNALDEELVFQVVRSPARSVSYPIGLILILFNAFSFYLAALVYVMIGVIQECLSGSMLKAMAVTWFLIVLSALAYPLDGLSVLLFGGNIAFPAVLFGWAIGDMFRPTW